MVYNCSTYKCKLRAFKSSTAAKRLASEHMMARNTFGNVFQWEKKSPVSMIMRSQAAIKLERVDLKKILARTSGQSSKEKLKLLKSIQLKKYVFLESCCCFDLSFFFCCLFIYIIHHHWIFQLLYTLPFSPFH